MLKRRFAAVLLVLAMILGTVVTALAAEMVATLDYNEEDVVSGGMFSAVLTFSTDVVDENGKLLYEFSSGDNKNFEVKGTYHIKDEGNKPIPNKVRLDIKVGSGSDNTILPIDIKAVKKSDKSEYSVKLKVDGTAVDELYVWDCPVIDDTAPVYISSYTLPSGVYPNQIFKLSLNFITADTANPKNLKVKFLTLEDTNFTIVNKDGLSLGKFEVTTGSTNTVFLKVSPGVTAGTYPLTFKAIVEYTEKDENGSTILMRSIIPLSQINVNVLEHERDDEEESSGPSESETEPILTPHIVITGFSTAGMDLADNENFTFSVSFKNTSRVAAIENVMVTVSLPEGVSMPFASTNFYIERVDPGKSTTLSFTLKGKKNIEDGVADLGLAFNYQYYFDGQYVSGSDSETVGLSFGRGAEAEEEEDRFEISNIETPVTLYPGEEDYLTITMINKGSKEIMNIQAKIEGGNLQNSGASEYYGLLDINKKDEIELPMIAINGGNVIGTVTITYELTDGTEKTKVKDFTAYAEEYCEPIMEPEWDDSGMMEPEPAGPAWWVWLIAAAGGVTAVIVTVVLLRKRAAKKRQEAIDAEDSEDE